MPNNVVNSHDVKNVLLTSKSEEMRLRRSKMHEKNENYPKKIPV